MACVSTTTHMPQCRQDNATAMADSMPRATSACCIEIMAGPPAPSPSTHRAAGGAGLEQAKQLLLVLHRRKGRAGGRRRRSGRHGQAPLLLPPAARRGGGDGRRPAGPPLCHPLCADGGGLAGHSPAGRHSAALESLSLGTGRARAAAHVSVPRDQCAATVGRHRAGVLARARWELMRRMRRLGARR